jgi:hypothetical protein
MHVLQQDVQHITLTALPIMLLYLGYKLD